MSGSNILKIIFLALKINYDNLFILIIFIFIKFELAHFVVLLYNPLTCS